MLLLHQINNIKMEQKQDILIGRDAELKHLEAIASSKEAEFVVVYGRRRVGKTLDRKSVV